MADLKAQLQQTLGDAYTLERELAGGGMSRVFVAHDRQFGRRVVVKTLGDLAGQPVSVERFRREIRVAAGLQQANIVPVHSAGDVDGVPYYTMPFVEGESLRARLVRQGAFPVREAVNILRDVARALAFAHERGVVHRDIKPENILLSGDTAVVTDFGIAKAIEASQSQVGATTLTHLGAVLGTPAYMSPEQAAGEGNIDQRADIYSLGAVAYELLSGSPPFVEKSMQATMAAHIASAPVPLGDRRPDVPARLASLVMRCLEKDPDRRPHSGTEFIRALDEGGEVSRDRTGGNERPRIIAVLPLANLGGGAEDEYFADGMTEDVITQLSQISSLRVIARTSVVQYKGTSKRARQIADELAVTHIVEGSARRAGNRVRIVAKLVDVATEAQLWAETFDRDLADVFAVQAEVAARVSEALVRRLTPSEQRRALRRPTNDLEAYNLFLRGRQEYNKGTAEAFVEAAKLFREARRLDPSFARAFAAEALIEVYHGGGYWGVAPRMAYERAVALADRALGIDPDVGEAHVVKASHGSWILYDFAAADEGFRRALELNPSHSFAHIMYAWQLATVGRIDDAIATAQRAVELDPVAPVIRGNAAFYHYLARRRDDFRAELRGAASVTELGMAGAIIESFDAIAYEEAARVLPAVRAIAAESPENIFNQVLWAWCAAAAGEGQESRTRLSALHVLESRQYVWQTGVAFAYAHLGDMDIAFRHLERAYNDRAGWMNLVGCAPAFDIFRGDRRFDDIVRRVGVPVAAVRGPG